ncbi:MAG: pro-sigmaK processing inhibitor BofA family protein [Defluviitaleaceae bacterium]|nr:pro-sigmaK processing inhibitor BofA family protein [Defluviitaleaceae bacterium]
MDYTSIITWMIIVCLIFIGLIVFAKPVKYILRFLIQAVCGMSLAIILNFILAPFSLAIGLNYLTFLITGLLGLPGFAMLYIISWMV